VKGFLIILISILFTANGFGQNNSLGLELLLKSKYDTVLVKSDIDLIIELTNNSNKAIWIPSDYFITSNLYPNGITMNKTGFEIRFNIQPISDWSKIYEEGSFIEAKTEYQEFKSGGEIKIKYDIGKHLRRHLVDFNDDKNLRLDLNKKIRITVELIFREQNSESSLNRLESNEIELFIVNNL